MLLSGSWTIADMNTNYKDIDFGILPYPVSSKTKKLVSPSGSWQLAVTTKSDKKEAASEFVKFATNTESSEIISLGNSVLPIRKSTIENIKDKVSEPMRFLMEQNSKTAHARPVVVAYPQVFNKQCKILAIMKKIQMCKKSWILVQKKCKLLLISHSNNL